MICRNVRCEASRQRGSDGGARAGRPDRAHRAPIRHHCSVALAQDAGDGRIDFPITSLPNRPWQLRAELAQLRLCLLTHREHPRRSVDFPIEARKRTDAAIAINGNTGDKSATWMPAALSAVTQPDAQPLNDRSEEHTSELQSRQYLVCRL